MSAESARAFCVRMMSDDEFRNGLGASKSIDSINSVLKEEGYSFSKAELGKVISEFVGRKLDDEELIEMVCEFYSESIMPGDNSSFNADVIKQWLAMIP